MYTVDGFFFMKMIFDKYKKNTAHVALWKQNYTGDNEIN